MIRLLRSFAWLRWRLFVNAFRGSKRRDPLERVSRAASTIIPVLLAVLFIPALIGIGVLGFVGGWFLGKGGDGVSAVTGILRIWLLGTTWIVILAPAIRSIKRPGSDFARFLLLPVPRRLLHLSELASGLADPWLAIIVPGLLLLPVGMAASGAIVAAALAALAGIGMLAALLSLESCVSSALGLLYRNRRRGEMVTLAVLLVISFSGFIPMVIDSKLEGRHGRGRGKRDLASSSAVESSRPGGGTTRSDAKSPAAEGRAGRSDDSSGGLEGDSGPSRNVVAAGEESDRGGKDAGGERSAHSKDASQGAKGSPGTGTERESARSSDSLERAIPLLMFVPSELYAGTLVRALQGNLPESGGALGGLLLFGAALYTLSWRAYRRLLDSPETGSRRRTGAILDAPARKLPGLSAPASSIAFVTIRAIRRTVQGKMAIYFSPVSLLVIFIMFSRLGSRGRLDWGMLHAGPVMAYLGGVILFLGYQKMMLNQFALDGAGLTLELLLPISEADLVLGKAAGIALLLGGPGLFCLGAAALLAPDASPWLWLAAAIGAGSGFVLFVPVGALLSALFPKPVDLGRFGSAGRPNQVAGLIGFMVTPLAFAPPVALSLAAVVLLRRPMLAPLFVAVWAIIAALISRWLVGLAAAAIADRRENLALVAQGR